MLNKSEVSLSVENVTVLLQSFFFFLFGLPLILEHLALSFNLLLIMFSCNFFVVFLPIKDGKSISVKLLLLFGFSDLTFNFLLGIEWVKLGVNLLFEHALLNLSALVNQLFLTFDLSSHNIELRVFFSQRIVGHFETLVKFALDQLRPFLLSLSFESLKTFEHGCSNLLRSLLLLVKFLFVQAVLSRK